MRVVRWLLWTLIAVLTLVVLAAGTIRTDWFRERVRRAVISRASPFLAGELTIGRVTGNVLEGLTFHDVALRQRGEVVIKVAAAHVTYDPETLIRGQYVLKELTLDRASVIAIQEPGGWNLAQLLIPGPPKPGEKPVRLVAERLGLSNGHVSLRARGRAPHELVDLNATGSLTYADSTTTLRLDSLTGRDETAGLTFREASASLTMRSNDVRAENLRLVTPESVVTGMFHWRQPAAEILLETDLRAQPMSFAELGRYVPSLTNHPLRPSGTLKASGTLTRWVVDLDAVSSAGNFAAVGTADVVSERQTFAGRVRAERFNVAPVVQRPDMATRITGAATVRASMPFADPSLAKVDFDGTASEAVIRGYRATQVKTKGTWDVDTVRGTARGLAYGSAVDVTGLLTPETLRYEGVGTVKGLNPRALGRELRVAALDSPRFDGEVNAAFDLRGVGPTLDQHTSTGIITLANSVVAGVKLPDARIEGTIADRRLSTTVIGAFADLTPAALGFDTLQGTTLRGRAHARINVADVRAPMTPEAIEVTADVTLESSLVSGLRVDGARIETTLIKGIATVHHFDVDSPSITATVTGHLALGELGESALTYTIATVDLTSMGERMGWPIAGRASLKGIVTGPRRQLRAAGTYAAHEPAYGESMRALTLNGQFDVILPDLDPKLLRGTAEGEGTFVTFGTTELQRLTMKGAYADSTLDFDASLAQQDRSLDLGGQLVLHPAHHELHVRRLAIGIQTVAWQLAPGGDAVVKYGAGQLMANGVTLARGTQRISLSGMLALGDEAGAAYRNTGALDLTFEGVEIADLNAMILGTRKLTGRVDGTARITGSTSEPVIDSNLVVTGGSVDGVAFERAGGTVAYRNGSATLDIELAQTATNRLTAKGTMPFSLAGQPASGVLDMRVISTPIDAGLLQVLSTHVNTVKGSAQFDLRATGSMTKPVVHGTVVATGVSFVVAATGMAYRDFNANLQVDGDAVRIQTFQLSDIDGHILRIEGGVQGTLPGELAGGVQAWWQQRVFSLDLRVAADRFHFLSNRLGEVEADVALKITGKLFEPEIQGTIRGRTVQLEIGELLNELGSSAAPPAEDDWWPPGVRTKPAAAPAAGPAPAARPGAATIFDRATVLLQVEMPDNVTLRGRDLRTTSSEASLGGVNVTVGGDLTVTKQPGATTAVVGRLEVVRGYYEFQGRRFNIAGGSNLRFRGDTPIDPALDIRGEREISRVTVLVNVRGTMRSPELSLSSRPVLDQSDILSLIVFNQPINELGQSERLALAERAGELAASSLATPIADSVARALDLDLFEIQTAGVATGGAASITLGRQIGDRLFVGLRQDLRSAGASQATFEYRITEFLRLVTSVSQGQQQSHASRRIERTGIDLIFVIRY